MDVYEILEEYVLAKKMDIEQGQPVIVEVRNTDTFERLVVKAQIAPPGRALEGADRLILRDLAENVAADDWQIRVIEELDPESVNIRPESELRKGAGRAA